jgi:hypothetical protein
MKSLILTLALALTTGVHAQSVEPEQDFDAMALYTLNTCAPTEYVENWLTVNSREEAVVRGNGAIMGLDNEPFTGIWKLWANRETRSFTILIEFPQDGMTCVVGLGEDLEPETSSNRINYRP